MIKWTSVGHISTMTISNLQGLRWMIVGVVALSACTGNLDPRGAPGSGLERAGGASMVSGGAAAFGGAGSVAGAATVTATGNDVPLVCDPAVSAPPSARIWRLSYAQYSSSVKRLLPSAPDVTAAFTAEVPGGVYSNTADGLRLPSLLTQDLFEAGKKLVELVVTERARFAPCMQSGVTDAGCVRTFIDSFASEAFRRPLQTDELDTYAAHFQKDLGLLGAAQALRALVRGLLQSPSFLYRTELGDPAATSSVVDMTAYEVASALSYTLHDAPPDAELVAHAKDGSLLQPQVRAEQVRRMLRGDTPAPRTFSRMIGELLGLSRGLDRPKDPALFPDFQGTAAAEANQETQRFVQHVLWNDGGSFAALLTRNYSFPSKALAKSVYGLTTPADFAQLELPAAERAGLLTQPAFLTAYSNEREAELVQRGKVIRERLLCLPELVPPPTVNAVFPPKDPNLTHRQRFERHESDPTCSACHQLIDPIGAGFEHYDALGRYIDLDQNMPIDASGHFSEVGATPIAFDGALELSDQLAKLPEARQCMTRQAFRFLSGALERAPDACALADMEAAWKASDGQLLVLVEALLSSDVFSRRTRP